MNRIKIFISSVQNEFAEERKRIAEYIRQDALFSMCFDPFLFEELPAQDKSAQTAYLEQAADAGIYLLLLGKRYGYEDANGISPTEREYDTATASHAYRIAFIKEMQEREPKEELFKQKIDDAVIRNSFNSYEELKSGVYASLIEYMITHRILRNGPFDASIHPEACIDDLDKDKIRWFVGLAREKKRPLGSLEPWQTSTRNDYREIEQGAHFQSCQPRTCPSRLSFQLYRTNGNRHHRYY